MEENKLLLEWIKAVKQEIDSMRDEMHSMEKSLTEKMHDLQTEVKIFKAKSAQRAAIISAILSTIVAGTGLIYSIIKISQALP